MSTLVIGAAGAAAGFAIGAPLGFATLGASIGWSSGVMLGGAYLNPQKIEGPRLTDLKLGGSSYGAYEPIVYGTVRLAGNLIWQTDLQEHSHTSGGGKGGSSTKTTTYTYSASFDVSICETQPVMIMDRIWADGRLIYEGSSTIGEDIPLTFYDGNETQIADSTEEADTGVGLTPAYRGIARTVFQDWDLSQFGNRIPQLEFRIKTKGFESGNIRYVKGYHPAPGSEWPQCRIVGQWTTDLDPDTPLDGPQVVSEAPALTIIGGGANNYLQFGGLACANGDVIQLWCATGFPVSADYKNVNVSSELPKWVPISPGSMYGYIEGRNYCYPLGIPQGETVIAATFTPDHRTMWLFTKTPALHYYKVQADTKWTSKIVDSGSAENTDVLDWMGFGNYIVRGSQEGAGDIAVANYAVSTAESNGQFVWGYYGSVSAGGGSLRLFKFSDAKVLELLDEGGHDTPNDTFIPTEGTKGVIFSMADGYVGTAGSHQLNPNPNHYTQVALWTRFTADHDYTYLWEIVDDLCDRAGLAAGTYDTDQLIDVVDGYIVSNQMNARSAIEALMPIFFFDAVESDGKIKFVKRGADPVASISDDDLACHEDGSELPSLLTFARKQEVDLPATMTLIYINEDAAYQTGTQIARRMATQSELSTTIQTTVVMKDTFAKQLCDALLYNAWLERDELTWYTSRAFVDLEPTDVVTVRSLALRITTKTEGATGVIKWTGVPSYAPVFAQIGQGGPSDGHGNPIAGTPQGTKLLLLDIPYLADPVPAFWAAMAGGERASWLGASLQRSVDGGSAYSEIATSVTPDIIGKASDILPTFTGGNVFDEISSVTVVIGIGGGTLESLSREAVINGGNEALLGYEVIQYRSAVLTAASTYKLTGLLRGRRGTDWAMGTHAADERFVKLPASLPIAPSFADYGIERLFKAVTSGRPLSSATAVAFTDRGVALAPYAPVHLTAGVNGSGDVILSWVRRDRVNGTWRDYVDIPMNEASEAYKVTLWTDDTHFAVAGTVDCTSPTTTITGAQQTTLWGGAKTAAEVLAMASVAQMGQLGPGYDTLGRVPAFTVPPPPPPPSVIPSDAIFVGDLVFDGSRVVTVGVTGGHPIYGKITVPSPLGSFDGKHATITVYEYVDGPRVRKIWLTQTFGARPAYPAYDVDTSARIFVYFNGSSGSEVTLNAGEVWYLMIAFEYPSGAPSLDPGEHCDFAINLSVPS